MPKDLLNGLVQLSLTITREDHRRLNYLKQRAGANRISKPTYSELAHDTWLAKLPSPPPTTDPAPDPHQVKRRRKSARTKWSE